MPKLGAFNKYSFTADVWNFTRRVEPTGGEVRTYFLHKSIQCNVAQTLFGRVIVTFNEDASDIMDQAQLRNLKDKFGNEVYPEGVWVLQGVVPNITPFGTREGYRVEAKLEYVDG